MKTTTTKILSTLVMLSLGACAIDQVDDSSDEDYTNEGRLSANGLTPDKLWSLGNLSAKPLTSGMMDTYYASTDAGRTVLPYLITCALGANQTVTYHTPNTVNATGLFGLATSWTSSALTVTQQELISSCVLAHVNEAGSTVSISVRGDEAGFQKFGNEALYDKQEGAWFGNLFSPTAYAAYSCRGSSDAPPSNRQCSLSGHCGMTWAGSCATVCAFTDDHASSCTINGTTFGNVTTVYNNN